jgi:hypothetical protein
MLRNFIIVVSLCCFGWCSSALADQVATESKTQEAPELQLQSIYNADTLPRLSDYAGQILILDFFSAG